MKYISLIFSLSAICFNSNSRNSFLDKSTSQIDFSNTKQIKVSDSLYLKIEEAYFNGQLFQSSDAEKWQKLNLLVSMEDFQRVFKKESENGAKNAYDFIPSGMLKLNDSIVFIIGTKSNFDQQGIILRSTDAAKSWKANIHPIPQTQMSPHDLVFLNSEIAICFFGVDQVTEQVHYAISTNAGESWIFRRSKESKIEFKKRRIRIHLNLDIQGQKQRNIRGKYSVDRGKTYSGIEILQNK